MKIDASFSQQNIRDLVAALFDVGWDTVVHFSEQERVSKHFMGHELMCPCCGVGIISGWSGVCLEFIRAGLPAFSPTSAYRCAPHNASLPNSKPNSNHLIGRAFDIPFPPSEALVRMVSLAFQGIGYGKHFTHVDNRLQPASWTY
jgi:hypothetical protein